MGTESKFVGCEPIPTIMKLNRKLVISFVLLYVLVPFLFIFPFYGSSTAEQPTPEKELVAPTNSVDKSKQKSCASVDKDKVTTNKKSCQST